MNVYINKYYKFVYLLSILKEMITHYINEKISKNRNKKNGRSGSCYTKNQVLALLFLVNFQLG